ncbi:MAG: hypothetical protein IT320_14330 [Anaerolineae bacterium]|nr:hypothetical protein [Anaerolineae bacterium]
MLRQLVSTVTEDDHLRLHRIPFTLLWFGSYGLAWYVLYIYEMLWYDGNFDPILSWLKWPSWREELVVGLLFGLTLSFVQTWLIRLRYGYVPRLWRIATILGATIAGFGYPRVGMRTGEYLLGLNWMGVNHPPRTDSLVNDFLIWFSVLGLFQAIVMLRINRKAWLIIIVGVLAGIIASVPLLSPRPLYGKPIWTLIMGTMVQASGTCLLLLHFMAHPRENVVPNNNEIKSNQVYTITVSTFILLWIGIYYLHLVLVTALSELWRFMVYYSPNVLYYGLDLSSRNGELYRCLFSFGIIGVITALGQQWLMKKHSNSSIPGWRKFTIVGWIFAGITWWGFRYVYPQPDLERAFMFGAHLAMPALFQAIPMNRAFRGGWMWAVVGVLAGVIVVFIRGAGQSNLSNFYGVIVAGLILSFTTALVFLRLQSRSRETQPTIAA